MPRSRYSATNEKSGEGIPESALASLDQRTEGIMASYDCHSQLRLRDYHVLSLDSVQRQWKQSPPVLLLLSWYQARGFARMERDPSPNTTAAYPLPLFHTFSRRSSFIMRACNFVIHSISGWSWFRPKALILHMHYLIPIKSFISLELSSVPINIHSKVPQADLPSMIYPACLELFILPLCARSD